MGVVQLSDPSGQYEAMLQESLNQYRDLFEKGADVIVTLRPRLEGEDVRARIIGVEKLTERRRQSPQGTADLRARRQAPALDRKPAESARRRRDLAGVMLGPGEDEVGSDCPAAMWSTRAAGALKAAPGVVEVEHV